MASEEQIRKLIDSAIAAPNPERFALIMEELRAALQHHIRQARTLMVASYYSKTLEPWAKVLAADAKQRIQNRDLGSAQKESPAENVREALDITESQR